MTHRRQLIIFVTCAVIFVAGAMHLGRSLYRSAKSIASTDLPAGVTRTPLGDGTTVIDERSSIPIYLGPTTGMFPDDWLTLPHNAKAALLSRAEADRSLAVVKSAMLKYPSAMLVSNLERVYIVGSLEFDGISAAGTNSANTVYIANQGVVEGFTDRYLEETFHHEFSSVLLWNHDDSFRKTDWMNVNPKEFRYGVSGVDSIKEGRASQEFEHEQHVEGFLNEYARGDIEDDFNSFAESLFMNSPAFWDVVDRYENVRKKAQLSIQFYHSLDSSLTEEWFRKLH